MSGLTKKVGFKPCVCRPVFIVTPSIDIPTLADALALMPAKVESAFPVPVTPGMVVVTRSITFRVTSGNCVICFAGSTVPTDAVDLVRSSSAAAVTSTACATVPTCSVKFCRICWAVPSVTRKVWG